MASQRRGNVKRRATYRRQVAAQLELPLTSPSRRSAGIATVASPLAASDGVLGVRFWPGFLGRKAPSPAPGEIPLNTKRAAHYLRRSSRWLELVRYKANSPPWRKVGGIFEYYESQLDWWKEQIADL